MEWGSRFGGGTVVTLGARVKFAAALVADAACVRADVGSALQRDSAVVAT